MVLTGVTISNNTATSGNGGAIYNWSSNPILTDVEISENHADQARVERFYRFFEPTQLTLIYLEIQR